ncbi:MAG: PHB depolymerase family esterase [Candidatus Margulisiibacteriota bacterium]
MRKKIGWFHTLIVLMVVFLSFFVSSCAINQKSQPAESTAQIPTGKSFNSIISSGKERNYLLYVPASYNGQSPAPLVFNFHGSGGNPEGQLGYSDFAKLAESKGFIVVLPAGLYQSRGRNSWNTIMDPEGVNDVQLVKDLIRELNTKLTIDKKRIYSTGMSGGARMVSRLGCELSETLAAIAPVAGIQHPNDCSVSRAVPVITFHAKKDLVNHYVHRSNSPGYWTTGVEESVSGWVTKNGCNKAPLTDQISSVVTKLNWKNCNNGAEVIFYRVEDGGHTWPGSPIVLTQFWAGKTNKDINASQLIWNFFMAHPLP